MSSWTDDSSAVLGLSHSATGELIDARGRKIVALPPSADGYRPELVDLGPAEMAKALEADEEARADREAGSVERLMREAPGGRTHGHSSSAGRRRVRPSRAFDRSTEPIVGIESADTRPITVSARVSLDAYRGIYAPGNPSFGEMAEILGRALAVCDWQTVTAALQSCAPA